MSASHESLIINEDITICILGTKGNQAAKQKVEELKEIEWYDINGNTYLSFPFLSTC